LPAGVPSGSTTPRWIWRCKLFLGFDERPFDEMGEEREIMRLSLPSEPFEIEHEQLGRELINARCVGRPKSTL